MLDFFTGLMSLFSGTAAQGSAQATTPPGHSPQSLGNLFQFDADGGAGWSSAAFGEPPEWAPWHPNHDDFKFYGVQGINNEGIGLTDPRLGSAAYPNSKAFARGTEGAVATPSRNPVRNAAVTDTDVVEQATGGNVVGQTSLAERNAVYDAKGQLRGKPDFNAGRSTLLPRGAETDTTPSLVSGPNRFIPPELVHEGVIPEATVDQKLANELTPDLPTRDPSAPLPTRAPDTPLQELHQAREWALEQGNQKAVTQIDQEIKALNGPGQLNEGPGAPGSHPELPAHQNVNTPPPIPELNTNRKLSVPLVKQTLNIQEKIKGGPWKALPRAASRQDGAALFRSGKGVMINLDTNSATRNGVPLNRIDPGIIIPDGASKTQVKQAWAYARGMAKIFKEQFGRNVKPWVRTTSQNGGRGRTGHMHTEPYAVRDTQAVAYFTTEAGQRAHANLLSSTLGKIPGAVFNIPHDGVSGAAYNGHSEVSLASGTMRWLLASNR